jgi:plasmid stabilization system protein ParE
VLTAIRVAVDRLGRHPSLGRAGRVEGTRELIISNAPYIVAYRVVENQVRILVIFHTSRQWPRRS